VSDRTVLDQLLAPLALCLDAESAHRIAEFRIAALVEQRAGELAERANEGLLTDDERSEYEALISACDFIGILKLKARRLSSNARP
jgi:anti-sigma factor RsiW